MDDTRLGLSGPRRPSAGLPTAVTRGEAKPCSAVRSPGVPSDLPFQTELGQNHLHFLAVSVGGEAGSRQTWVALAAFCASPALWLSQKLLLGQ